MAITGIVMMAYADGFHGDSITGVAYAVGSASTSALYKVGHCGASPSSYIKTHTQAPSKIDLETLPLLSLLA